MQDRWVSYIYRYNNHKRCENTGYIKVIKTNKNKEEANIQIGLKLFKTTLCRCKIYIIYQQNKLFQIGEELIKPQEKDTISINIALPWNDFGVDGITPQNCNGIYFLVDDGDCLMSTWWEKEVDTRSLSTERDVKSEIKPEVQPEVQQEIQSEMQKSEVPLEIEELVAVQEIVETDEGLASHEDDKVDLILRSYTKLPLFIDSPFSDIVKIIPQDIGKLPIGNWKLGSNSFVMHGYYKYKYLMLGKVNLRGQERIVIGVPGVYTNKEKYMANMFGFNMFVPVKKADVKTGNFGYWVWEVLRQ